MRSYYSKVQEGDAHVGASCWGRTVSDQMTESWSIGSWGSVDIKVFSLVFIQFVTAKKSLFIGHEVTGRGIITFNSWPHQGGIAHKLPAWLFNFWVKLSNQLRQFPVLEHPLLPLTRTHLLRGIPCLAHIMTICNVSVTGWLLLLTNSVLPASPFICFGTVPRLPDAWLSLHNAA